MGRLLDAYDRLQAQPFGQWTARNSDPGLRQMTSQRRDLTSALRRGIKNARNKGDAKTVLDYQTAGNSMGLQTSGIGNYDQRKEGDFAFEQDTRIKTGVNRDLADRALGGVGEIGDADAPDAATGDSFVSRIESKPMSFAEQEAAKRESGALAGNFGAVAASSALRKGASDLLDEAVGDAVDYEIGTDPETGKVAALPKVDEKKASRFVARATALGGSSESFLDALRRKANRMGGVRA